VVYRIAMILLMAVSGTLSGDQGASAQESPSRDISRYKLYCDGVPCKAKPTNKPWWTCDEDTYLTPEDRRVSAQQLRRLEDFGLGIFSPALPGYGRQDSKFTRSDLIKRFGPPLSTRSVERLPYDPSTPMEVVTAWEYSGFRITTVASKPNPEELWIDEGEIFDATVSLRYGVRIGQSIQQWARQFGRPNCIQGVPPFSQRHLVYDGQYYFACGKDKSVPCVATYQIELYLDGSGKVNSMRWSHPML